MKLNYKISLPKHLNGYLKLRDAIMDWVFDYEECTIIDDDGVEYGYVVTLRLDKKLFEELKQHIFVKFSMDLSDGVYVDYEHYHIVRYDDNDDILHEATAFETDDNVWEVYYTDGLLSELPIVRKGTLPEEGIYLFEVEISSNEKIEDKLEHYFDKWIEQQK
ncbi:hypothetical protein V7068_17405 [Bacillus sp. JJ634]